MSRNLRWSEAAYQSHLAKQDPTPPAAAAVPAARPKSAKRGKSARVNRLQQAIDSLEAARIDGHHCRGVYFEFTLDGARLLSVNEVLALHHYQRMKYRKAWHTLASNVLLVVTRGPRHWAPFKRFVVTAHRRSPVGCDVDALNGHFKYIIDGLRYAGLLVDDSRKHMLEISATQSVGAHMLHMRIEALPQAIQPAVPQELSAAPDNASVPGVPGRQGACGTAGPRPAARAGSITGHAGES